MRFTFPPFFSAIGAEKKVTKKSGIVVVAAVVTLTVGTMWASQAWAQDATEPTEAETMTLREDVRQAGLEAAAGVLGMTPDEVSDQLWGGKTLADLAEEANVELSDVRAAVEAAVTSTRQQRIKALIAERVADGSMSQEQADWIVQGIDNGWFGLRRFAGRFDGLGADGFGLGQGMGRMRLHEQAIEPSE